MHTRTHTHTHFSLSHLRGSRKNFYICEREHNAHTYTLHELTY